MKNFLAFITLLIIFNPVFSQVKKAQNDPGYDYKRLHFGFTVGLNTMDFGIRRPEMDTTLLFADVSRISPGFQVSIVSDLRLADYFSLRFLPGITFGQRTIQYYNNDSIRSYSGNDMELESNYLDFPLLVKYKSKRVNNYAPYLIAGSSVRYDLAARRRINTTGDTDRRLRPVDIYFEFGFGIDYYLKYFKFSTELKLSAGLRDIWINDDAKYEGAEIESIDRLNSYLVMLCFHFE